MLQPKRTRPYRAASYYQRCMAGLIDFSVTFLLILLSSSIILFVLSFNPPPQFWEKAEHALNLVQEYPFIIVIILLCIFTSINGYSLHTESQTIGQHFMHIKMVRCDESKASILYTLIYRYWIGIGFGLCFLISETPDWGIFYLVIDIVCMLFTSGQCIHDAIADIMVVRIPNYSQMITPFFRIKHDPSFTQLSEK
jgi:uncharacterized RDD family membrane protein YckC